MDIQLSGAEIASAPALSRSLDPFGRLSVSELTAPELQPDAYAFNRSRADSWASAATAAVTDAGPFSLVVCRLEGRATPSVVSRLYSSWDGNRARANGRYVTSGVAFSVPSRSFEWIARDLAHLWGRAADGVGPESRPLALVVVRDQPAEGASLFIRAPMEGTTARYMGLLAANPVVSGEVLHGAGLAEPAYRRSNRIAALRQMGLLVPLPKWLPAYARLKAAHAELVGRAPRRQRTLFYRSILYDLVRSRSLERADRPARAS